MIAPFSPARVFTAWTPDFPMLVLVLALGVWYFFAQRRVPDWPRSRTAAFLAGVATILLVTCSFLGVYDDVLFWPRAVQVVVLLMITPLLLALGAPLTLVLATAPGAARLRAIGRGRVARALTFPLVITVLLIVPPLLIYLTPLYELCLRNGFVDTVVRLALIGCGFGYFWTRLRVDPTPREDHHLVSFAISFADLRTDQIIGAGILWIGGDLAGLPFVGALAVRWLRADERQAKQIDEELDAQEQAPESTGGLWWENDPNLTERFKREQ